MRIFEFSDQFLALSPQFPVSIEIQDVLSMSMKSPIDFKNWRISSFEIQSWKNQFWDLSHSPCLKPNCLTFREHSRWISNFLVSSKFSRSKPNSLTLPGSDRNSPFFQTQTRFKTCTLKNFLILPEIHYTKPILRLESGSRSQVEFQTSFV